MVNVLDAGKLGTYDEDEYDELATTDEEVGAARLSYSGTGPYIAFLYWLKIRFVPP